MKKIILYLSIVLLLITNFLYSQEVTIDEEYDAFEDRTWYTPNFDAFDRYSNIYLYIGKKKDIIYLRLVAVYRSDDWLFLRKLILLHDGKRKEIEISYNNRDSKVLNGGRIRETADILVNDELLEYLESYSKSSNAKLRYSGEKYYDDIDVKDMDMQGLRLILNKYKELQK